MCAIPEPPPGFLAHCTSYMQYNDNVVGAGSPRYDNAYFEISFIRAYSATTMLSPSLSLSSLPSSLSTLIPSPLSSSLRAPFTSGSPGTSSVRPVVTALGPASTSGADLSTWAGLVHLHAYILFLATFLVASEA